ncbi:MAG: pilus assembly protein [Desulfobulbaceae bacterium]|nr:pilus assembly protein [Desulfobulbaceae bacterium]
MRNQTQKKQTGATVVEFAIIVPLFLLIIFGIVEYGIIYMQRHLVENAAREGVRRGVVADTYDCWQGNCAAPRYTAVVTRVQDYLNAFYPDITDSPGPNDNNVVTVERDPTSTDPKWLIVTVEVENFMPRLISIFLGSKFNLQKIRYTARGEYENSVEE